MALLLRQSHMTEKEAAAPRARPIASEPVNGITPVRGPGRPPARDGGTIGRTKILRSALKLAATVPLQELSLVVVAKAMKVTPALIHYYLGGRDWLTSGVMSLFYKDLLKNWPAETGDWKADLVAASRALFDHFLRYAGIAAYCVSNSRFRIHQLTAYGDREYGVEVLDRFAGRVRTSGLSGERTGIYANQLFEFLISTAHATAQHIYPAEHIDFLEEKAAKLNRDRYKNLEFVGSAPFSIDGDVAFKEGLDLYLLGISTEIAAAPAKSRRCPKE